LRSISIRSLRLPHKARDKADKGSFRPVADRAAIANMEVREARKWAPHGPDFATKHFNPYSLITFAELID
jgi:hypothetical protein